MSRLELKKISEARKRTGLSVREILSLNPQLKKSIIDEARDNFFCWQHGLGQKKI